MKCLILAAGYATRLYPLTENFPKPLLMVKNKTILDWIIDDIDTSNKISEYIVVTNHKFAHYFNEWASTKKQKITIVDDGTMENEKRLGAVKDIQLGLNNCDEDVLVMAGDNVLNFSLKKFIEFFEKKNCSCIMAYQEKDQNRQKKTGIITFDNKGLVTSFEEKPANPKGDHAVPPFYIYKAKDISRIDEALKDGCECDAPGSFVAWLCHKTDVFAYIMPGIRYDIGDILSYQKVQEEYKGITI